MKSVSRKITAILLVVSLLLVLLGSLLSYSVDTDWGNVKIERISLVDDDGYSVSGILRIPANATADTPAPVMIVVPGGDCTGDIASPWANEITRRGYVTFAVDYTGAGDTQINQKSQYFGSNGSMQLDTAYDYLASLAFVDTEQIGVCGHSMGSLYSYRLALQRDVALVVSDVIFADASPTYDFSYVQISAEHDEGILARIDSFEDIYKDPMLTSLFDVETIEPNRLYGSWEDRTARIFYPVNLTHQDDMVAGQFISTLTGAIMDAIPAPNPLNSANMVYGWKIVGLFIAIVGMVMFLFSLSSALLQTQNFAKLKLAPSADIGFASNSRSWWAYLALLATIPVATFFPGTAIGNKMKPNQMFQLGATPNGYMTWALLSAVVMVIMLVVLHNTVWKKKGANLKSYGIATLDNGNGIGVGYLLRSVAFGTVVLSAAYGLLMLVFQLAKTDLHLVVLSMRPLSSDRLATFPWYTLALLPYLLTVMVAGCGMNNTTKSGNERPVWKTVLIGTFTGLSGLIILYAVFQIILRFTAIGPFYTANFANFYLSLLAVVIPEFGVATALGIYLSKKTNCKWVGAITASAIIAFCMVSSNGLSLLT